MGNPDSDAVDVIVHNLDSTRYRTIVSVIGDEIGGHAATQDLSPGLESTFEELIPTIDYAPDFVIEIVLNGEVKYSETKQLDDGFEPRFTIRDGEITMGR